MIKFKIKEKRSKKENTKHYSKQHNTNIKEYNKNRKHIKLLKCKIK